MLITVLLLLPACSIDNSPSYNKDESVRFIKADHKGCRGLLKTTEDSYLVDHYYIKDTLCLNIHFRANCCPEFVDSADVSPGYIKLFVRDTLSGCRCICDYLDDYRFMYNFEGETKLEFRQAGLSGAYELGFETTF